MNDALLTLPDLVAATAEVMANWPQPDNGQVRALPDARTLRWYGTIGLLDRPLAWRGRTALYGDRHRLQVLAIKRLQLAGWPIANIQQELLNTSDADLARIAGSDASAPVPTMVDAAEHISAKPFVKAEAPAESESVVPGAVAPSRRERAFWAASAAQPAVPPAHSAARLHLTLAEGAELVLPADTDLSELDAALAPLRAWLNRTRPHDERKLP